MTTLPTASSPVHPESAAAFLARLERDEASEHTRIVREYPTGAARLYREARRMVTIARSLDSGYATQREYDRALADLDFACDEMERCAPPSLDPDPTALPDGDPIGDRDDRTEPPVPMPGGLVDVELSDLPDEPEAMGASWSYPGVLPAISGGAPEPVESEWDLAGMFEPFTPSDADQQEYATYSASLDDSGAMAFPEPEYSLEDRRRWQHQSNLSEASFVREVE